MGSFLVFYGLSSFMGTRPVLPFTVAVFVSGSLGDIFLFGGLNPLEWVMVNSIVFVHVVLGALMGHVLADNDRTIIVKT
jgi:hypothetical protein